MTLGIGVATDVLCSTTCFLFVCFSLPCFKKPEEQSHVENEEVLGTCLGASRTLFLDLGGDYEGFYTFFLKLFF